MKKTLLTLLGGALLCLSASAQDEDVTYYIQNAGFDEDLTFQADGTMKEAVSTETSLSDRSWAYIAADSTVYARPKSTSSQNRPDGRKLEAVNGFIGRVQGWTLESSAQFPKCEWTYFGTAPYALGETAVPIADDGTTYLTVPERPSEFEGGEGFVYLRAGWGGQAIYKQVVKLPCAVYRLEYWTKNINANTSATATDLSQIVCRKDVFKDEEGTGLSAQEWTKHTFEFIPTAEFSMQFGFKSANAGSGANPIVCLDGIKLYKIGEADPIQLLESDVNDLIAECEELAGKADMAGYLGLAEQIGDYGQSLDDLLGGDDQATLEAGLAAANAQLALFREALDAMDDVDAILNKMDELLQTTDYAGKAELEAAYQRILGYKQNGLEEDVDVAAQILGAVAEATAAIKAYYMTQTGSEENPADFTIFIEHPWFIDTAAEPSYIGGEWIFPKQYDEDGNDLYTEGSASSADLNSEGWYIAGGEGGDQRLNWQRGRSCWNAWNNNFTTTVAVAQDIEGLPNGFYTIAADLITQSGCLNDQHVFGKTVAGKNISTTLSGEGWDFNEWETLSMTAEQKVLVVDGKLTIGAEGTGIGSGAAGWFCATNFHLYFLGEATAEDIQAAYAARLDEVKAYAAAMHFAADRNALNDAIAQYGSAAATDDIVAALQALAAAMEEAEKSEAKYEEYIPADGTIDGKTIPTVMNTLKRNGGDGYGAAEDIVAFAYDYVMGWMNTDAASYTDFDAVVDLLKNYVNTYAPVYNNANAVANAASATGRAVLQDIMATQKASLTSEMKSLEVVNEYVDALNSVVMVVNKQNIVDDANATDYTAFIVNPNMEAETGWTFDKGNGNTNTTSGQWLDGSSTRYIDSYNSAGLRGYIATQLITDLPNGTYKVGVYTRTPAEGAYILNAVGTDTVFVEIPMNYYATVNDAGEDTLVVASDMYGPIWEEAVAAVDAGTYTDQQLDIYNANGGNGRGWQHQVMDNIVVTGHELLIGTMSGTEASNTPKAFAGAWYSVGGWTLTLLAKGDNSGWGGPVAEGISSMTAEDTVADGIYTLSGVKVNRLQHGLNIVVSNGQARKLMVK